MINDITNYVLVCFRCPSDIGSVEDWEGNMLHDFGHIPTFDEIRKAIIEDGNKQLGTNVFSYCIIRNIQFLSKHVYEQLKGNNNDNN